MPILISQLVTKPILYVMGLLNIFLLGVCAYLLLVPASGPKIAASVLPNSQSPPQLPSASFNAPDQFDQAFTQSYSTSPSRGNPLAAAPSIPAPASSAGLPATPSEEHVNLSVESTDASDSSSEIPATADSTISPRQSITEVSSQVSAIPAAGQRDIAQQPAAVPLAFTTSADGATPSQAAALGRLQSEFVNNLGGSAQNPNDPAYALAWQAAQRTSDSNFEEQFGTQAFIRAQLAQVQGGAH